MNTKTIGILLVILIILVGLFFLRLYIGGPKTSSESLNALKTAFNPSDVAAIQVFKQSYPDSGLYFAKIDTLWVVSNEFNTPAKITDMNLLLADLDSVSGPVRGESADLFPDFELSDEMALQIRLLSGNGSLLLHLFVGKGGADGKSCFVRLPGSPKVYLADRNFISRFGAWQMSPEKKLPTNRWIELLISPVKRDELAAFKVQVGKTEYQFELINETQADTASPPSKFWKQLNPTRGYILDEPKIRNLAGIVTSLRGNGVTNPEYRNQFNLPASTHTIHLASANGLHSTIRFSDKVNEAEDRYVVADDRPIVFVVNKATFDRIFVTPLEKPKENK